ncbi:hypothetical protein Pla22_38070 [Rubripirellula amarantea]|uniref:Addiction module component n=1 Tax=Rubripirellula amarantea TaxID=2527999 RepID=A0A5C5WLT0_9BACT|nr:hypothetical protein [Rubripirellula amarantea]TWT51031.1 hypothetical protein Pla22_38070 [Rubripirellula amarantea]
MTLEEIEQTIVDLPPDQMAKFREWFLEFDAKRFDERIEQDAKSGRLDQLAAEALKEHAAGRTSSL